MNTVATGDHFAHVRQYRKAITCYRAALRLDPKCTNAYIKLIRDLIELDDLHNAIYDATSGIGVVPKCAALWFERSRAYYGLNDYKHALADINKAIQLNSNFAYYYGKRADYEITLNDREAALKDYSHAVEICAHSPSSQDEDGIQRANEYSDILKDRGNLYKLMGKYEEAINDYTAALKRPQTEPARILHNRADCYDKLGKHDIAAKDRKLAEDSSHDVLDDLMKER